MTRKELIKKIEDCAGISRTSAAQALDCVLDAFKEDLTGGNDVAVKGFGTFKVKTRAARTGRNPQTGEEMQIPESKTVSFRPAKALKDELK